MLCSRNPATGEIVATFKADSADAVDNKLQRAADAFYEYRTVPFEKRASWLLAAADILEQEKHALGKLMTQEMGKPISAAVSEAAKCAQGCRYYAEHGPSFLAGEEVHIDSGRAFVRYQPLGPVLAIMPWNFPFWQVFRFTVPALMAGNTALLKHASNVPRCALAIEDLLKRAGVPDGVFQALMIGSQAVDSVISDKRVMAVTLTGSVEAGRSVAAKAGKCLKKSVLELGGSDPFVIMPSANIDQAVHVAVQARIINNGQSCIAAKRFIVHERIAGEVEQKFVAEMAALRIGDPMLDTTEIGPLATAEVLDSVELQTARSISAGARLLLGGKRINGSGWFFEPTVLCDVPPDAPARSEELFGPVATLIRVRDIDDAIAVANETSFGLGAAIWTNDARELEKFVDEVEAGMAFANGMVASDPRLPFGGIKDSGYGRELGAHGIREFTNVKTIVKIPGRPPVS